MLADFKRRLDNWIELGPALLGRPLDKIVVHPDSVWKLKGVTNYRGFQVFVLCNKFPLTRHEAANYLKPKGWSDEEV